MHWRCSSRAEFGLVLFTPTIFQVPKIFHVNWFRVDDQGNFLWPGYGENIRVLDWIIRRVHGEEGIAEETPIGYVPKKGELLSK